MKTPRILLLVGSLSLVLAACSAGAPSPSPVTTPPPSAAPSDSPSVPPEEPVSGDPGDPGIVDPGMGEPQIVSPVPGLVDIRDVGASALTAAVNGRQVTVRVAWTSGVEPCYALAGVDVVRDGDAFTLTVREGSADPGAACIEIAVFKATDVDLGELEPGTYTISAFGDAAPIEVTVS